MALYPEIHDDLTARRTILTRRVRDIEEDLAQQDDSSLREGRAAQRSARALSGFVQESRREIALINASLRRIADRTFDVCIHCGATIPERLLRTFPFTVSCQECSRGFDVAYFEKIRSQQVDLRRSVTAIRTGIEYAVEGEPETVGRGAGPGTMRVLLRILRRELTNHFDLKESGGYLEEVVLLAPRLSRSVAALREEHRELLQRLDEIIGHTQLDAPEEIDWLHIRGLFLAFTDDVERHEQSENDIVSHAFMDDIGSGD